MSTNSRPRCAWLLLPILSVLPALAAAQGAPARTGAATDPANPAAAVPRVVHRSALASFRGSGGVPAEAPPQAWREANDTVARIGGWRAYAREAAAAAAASAAASGVSR